MSITVQAVSKVFGAQKAVDQLSFTAEKGRITGFLGPNGAGKSTTMKMIMGYLKPDGGEILVAGTSVLQDPLTAKQKLGYLPESNALYYDMYVREYLEFTAGVYGLRQKRQAIASVIGQVGLQPEAHKKIGQLSKGYKQRVGLAAAIIHQPEVLILDEPTSGLDPNQIVDIRRLIQELGREKTVLLSTHIMQEVEAICDQVIIINKGKKVADDTLNNLRIHNQSPVLKVGFEEALEAAWLERLPAVRYANKINTLLWELHGEPTDEMRRQVLQLAQEHSLNITSMQNSGGSLEQIFRSLTATDQV